MNELQERLAILEMKLVAIAREMRTIRSKMADTEQSRASDQRGINFFTALQADDDVVNDEYTAMTKQ